MSVSVSVAGWRDIIELRWTRNVDQFERICESQQSGCLLSVECLDAEWANGIMKNEAKTVCCVDHWSRLCLPGTNQQLQVWQFTSFVPNQGTLTVLLYIFFLSFFLFWFETRKIHRFVSRGWACKSQVSSRRSIEETQSNIGTWDDGTTPTVWLYMTLIVSHSWVQSDTYLLILYAIWAIHVIKYRALTPVIIIARVTCIGHHTLRDKILRMSPVHLSERENKNLGSWWNSDEWIYCKPLFCCLHACVFTKATRSTFTGLYICMSVTTMSAWEVVAFSDRSSVLWIPPQHINKYIKDRNILDFTESPLRKFPSAKQKL